MDFSEGFGFYKGCRVKLKVLVWVRGVLESVKWDVCFLFLDIRIRINISIYRDFYLVY